MFLKKDVDLYCGDSSHHVLLKVVPLEFRSQPQRCWEGADGNTRISTYFLSKIMKKMLQGANKKYKNVINLLNTWLGHV